MTIILVQRLFATYLISELHAVCLALRTELPQVWKVDVCSGGGGGGNWHVFSIGCYLEANNWLHRVCLQIDVCSLDSTPLLQALVWWDKSADYEFELFPQPVPVSNEVVQEVSASLPQLVEILKDAVHRGRPKSQIAELNQAELKQDVRSRS